MLRLCQRARSLVVVTKSRFTATATSVPRYSTPNTSYSCPFTRPLSSASDVQLPITSIIDVSPLERGHTIARADASHPLFKGHFPGHPVVPGVVILELMFTTCGLVSELGADARLFTVNESKFSRAFGPDTEIHIQVHRCGEEDGIVTYECTASDRSDNDARPFATAKLSLTS